MKVKELIELLQKFDKEKEITVHADFTEFQFITKVLEFDDECIIKAED